MRITLLRALPAAVMGMAASLLGPAAARADDVPDNSVRLGLYSVFYHTSAQDFTGEPFPLPAHLNIKAEDVETLYAAYVRRLSVHFNLELALGWPPLTKTEGQGPATVNSTPGSPAYNGQVLSTARWFSPTLLVNYLFFDDNARLRPYIGVGVNYTSFYDRDSTAAGDAASGGPTRLELPASVGPAGTLGLSYQIAPHWGLVASYSISQVNTKLLADTAGEYVTTHIKFKPQALVVAAAYSF
jgi:outer membrane protein